MRRANQAEAFILKVAASQIGVTEKGKTPKRGGTTPYGIWWAERMRDTYYRTAPWCAMFTLWCAYQSYMLKLIPKSASTIEMAKAFQRAGRWSTTPQPGALAFFDWGGAGLGAPVGVIDHVGFVEKADGRNYLITIEGNTSDMVARRRRSMGLFVGFGLPDYAAVPPARLRLRDV